MAPRCATPSTSSTGQRLRLGPADDWSLALQDDGRRAVGEPISPVAVVGTGVCMHLQRCLPPDSWYEASLGARANRQGSLAGDLASSSAADRHALSWWAGHVERRPLPGDQPARLRRGDPLHRRLQSGARRDRPRWYRRRPGHGARDHRQGGGRTARGRAARPGGARRRCQNRGGGVPGRGRRPGRPPAETSRLSCCTWLLRTSRRLDWSQPPEWKRVTRRLRRSSPWMAPGSVPADGHWPRRCAAARSRS